MLHRSLLLAERLQRLLTFTTGVGSCTITGTQTQHSAAATDSFTVTAPMQKDKRQQELLQ